MIRKFVFGHPYETYAVVEDVPVSAVIDSADKEKEIPYFTIVRGAKSPYSGETSLCFSTELEEEEAVYGLGETVGGIDKRGKEYISYNTDEPHHRSHTRSLYGSHNFLVIGDTFGVFFDTPSRTVFDVDVDHSGVLEVFAETEDLILYVIEGESTYDIVKQFRRIIGRSFLPPLWAFGFCQSRWGYRNEKDITEVVRRYRKADIPLDSVCMDIDYMDRYIDFTVHPKRFPDLKKFSDQMKKEGIHLVPIIDAGVKVEPGNPVYEEGVANGYFCTNEAGEPFQAAVWPGMTHFPDFFQEEAREWFGSQYKVLTDCGIEGFWNDMNEPAIFYSECSSKRSPKETILTFISPSWAEKHASEESNAYKDYKNFYHKIDGTRVQHHKVHNLFGGLMTMADHQGLHKLIDHRFLLYSRSSYIGAHRYGGIWTGDNESRWDHLRLNVCQMPSLHMCGFLYTGADIGGFGGNTDRELLLRWLAFAVFTPLMRNHSSLGTRPQECYRFGDPTAFRKVIRLRYRLLPYLYSEFMKAALKDEMYMRPLAFDYPDDPKCRRMEDQLMVGGEVMVAPILEKGTQTRKVYLPEDMTLVRFNGETFRCKAWKAGEHQITVDLDEVVFFIRSDRAIVVARKNVSHTAELDLEDVTLLGDGTSYEQYIDDGFTRDVGPDHIRTITKTNEEKEG